MLKRNRPSFILQHVHKPSPGKALIILPLLLIFIHSCYNDPNFLGNNLIPEEDIYAVKTDTLFEVSAYSIQSDTMLATSGYLGYYNSEIFGSTKGSFVGRYLPTTSTEGFGGPTAKPDSLFFYFKTSSFYGDTLINLAIRLHEITDTAAVWNPTNSLVNLEGKYNPNPLASASYRGSRVLKIAIDTTFARSLMDSSALANPKEFYTKFKGIYLTCDDLDGFGGVAYYLSTSETYFRLYYHYTKVIDGKDSTISTNKAFTFNSYRFFQYLHNPSTATPSLAVQHLNDTVYQDTVFYVQGMGGVYGKISLDDIAQWKDSVPVAINRAELVIGRVIPQTVTSDSSLSQLLLYYKDKGVWAGVIPDQISQTTGGINSNGKLRLYNNDYSIVITSHLQRILNGEISDKNLYVFPNKTSTFAYSVLQTGNSNRKIKLKLTYTKIR